jgi:hypothetical protein
LYPKIAPVSTDSKEIQNLDGRFQKEVPCNVDSPGGIATKMSQYTYRKSPMFTFAHSTPFQEAIYTSTSGRERFFDGFFVFSGPET